MARLIEDIKRFLEANGFSCSVQMLHGLEVICTTAPDGVHGKVILPLEISAHDSGQAIGRAEEAFTSIRMIRNADGAYPLIVVQDRWITQREMMEKRLLSHLEMFLPIYARNCEMRKIDKTTAREFLERNHSYGHAACRYCYGLFFKRHTGHIAEAMNKDGRIGVPDASSCGDGLMAVATFSNARKWVKGDVTIRSYEWTRYASLPQVRLSGGMGKLLKAFIEEVQPDDIMSYADLEWSEGEVYERLGFRLEGFKEPVMFHITEDWQRKAVKRNEAGEVYFQNFGSNKYRLKLTDYQ